MHLPCIELEKVHLINKEILIYKYTIKKSATNRWSGFMVYRQNSKLKVIKVVFYLTFQFNISEITVFVFLKEVFTLSVP
jgi:hypothetical protein